MLRQFVKTILGFSAVPASGANQRQNGKSIREIHGRLNVSFMRGQVVQEDEVRECLQQMVLDGDIGHSDNQYYKI